MAVSQEEDVKCWSTDVGYIYIREGYCKGCDACIEFCPRDVLEESDELNRKGYRPPEPTNPEDCLNCGLCERICPDFAIWTEKVEGETGYES